MWFVVRINYTIHEWKYESVKRPAIKISPGISKTFTKVAIKAMIINNQSSRNENFKSFQKIQRTAKAIKKVIQIPPFILV